MNENITWEEIIAVEPKLDAMYQEAVKHREQGVRSEQDCPNVVWYKRGGIKSRFVELVGNWCRKPEIGTTWAYDVAYDKIYNALADCSENCCLREEDIED